MDHKLVSLSQLVGNIKNVLNNTFNAAIWVVSEISEFNVNYSGHCYLELVEKDEQADKLLAKSRATIWARSFRIIQPYFETTTRETLRAGLKVLIKVTVEFHELYGFSLNIIDIDPSFTVGDLALKRNLIIEKLKNEGVFEMNKQTEMPLVPQRIAVITSETAAGYGDFQNQLKSSSNNYIFNATLFPAIVQGEKAPESIRNAFYQVFDRIDEFDIVVLIRGGGSKIDLSCFDDYDLAYVITQLPLPVITGIGHERDESISDLVAHTNLKTPTAVAEYLIDIFDTYHERLLESFHSLVYFAESYFEEKGNELKDVSAKLQYQVKYNFNERLLKLENYNSQLQSGVEHLYRNKEQMLENLAHRVGVAAKVRLMHEQSMCELRQKRLTKWSFNLLQTQNTKLNHISAKLSLLDPEKVLQRGFAIVTSENGVVKDAGKLKAGNYINIKLHKGAVESEVKKVNKP